MADQFCSTCGKWFDHPMRNCPRCGVHLTLHCPPPPVDPVEVQQTPAVRGDYSKPIELQSMGFIADPGDVAEHRSRFPNVELRMKDGSAIPVIRSLGQKRAYLKAAGWVDTRSF